MKNYKKSIATILSFCLLFVMLVGNVSAEDNSTYESSDLNNITVIENNSAKVTVMGEKDGLEAYVTYDKITHEVTARTIEQPQNVLGFSLMGSKETEYSIDVITAVDGQLTAYATNTESNEVLSIKESNLITSDIVQAQAPVALIPVGQWLGSLILAALATSAIIVVNDMEYVNLSDTKVETDVKKDPTGYYYAHVDKQSNLVYIGPKMNYNAALSWLKASHENNIFTPTEARARTLAKNVTTLEPIHHTNEYLVKGEGYFKHFHPYNPNSLWKNGKLPNHIWYFK